MCCPATTQHWDSLRDSHGQEKRRISRSLRHCRTPRRTGTSRQYVRVIYAFGYTLVCGVRQRMALGTVIYVSAKPALGGRTITEVQELLGCDLLHLSHRYGRMPSKRKSPATNKTTITFCQNKIDFSVSAISSVYEWSPDNFFQSIFRLSL